MLDMTMGEMAKMVAKKAGINEVKKALGLPVEEKKIKTATRVWNVQWYDKRGITKPEQTFSTEKGAWDFLGQVRRNGGNGQVKAGLVINE